MTLTQNGSMAIIESICAIRADIAALTARVAQLEFLISEEIGARLTAPLRREPGALTWLYTPGYPADDAEGDA